MFYVPGWISLKEVVSGVSRYYREYEIDEFAEITDADPDRPPFFSSHHKAFCLIWHKLSEWANNDTLGVLMPSGLVVNASEELVACRDKNYSIGECITLDECTVGSATWEIEKFDLERGVFEAPETLQEKRVRYGAYLFCPVVVHEDAYGPLLTTLQGDHHVKREPMTIEEIIKKVVEEYEIGAVRPTKKYLRENYMPNEKYETFLAVWREITARCPDLKKGGRPKT